LDWTGLVVIRKLAIGAAILAFLAPTEAPVRNRLRADELERTEDRVPFRNKERLPHHRNFHELLKGPEYAGHY
jgi:hypothetical protein